MALVAGIDVGAAAKGFHVAVKQTAVGDIGFLLHVRDAGMVCDFLRRLELDQGLPCQAIAVDAPARSSVEKTRPAERALVRSGKRVLWTPRRESGRRVPWMENGAVLWRRLEQSFPAALLCEAFPSGSADCLYGSAASLALRLLAGREQRKYHSDYLDAAVCALIAEQAWQSCSDRFGEDDPVGPIHLLHQEKRLLTLCIVRQGEQLLLGMKKRGFGHGKWNGFGGKVEPGESLEQAMQREAAEEVGIQVLNYEKRGILWFTFAGDRTALEVHVYLCEQFRGEIRESEEMRPAWFSIAELPWEQMWADDPYWLPLLLQGTCFHGRFFFNGEQQLVSHSLAEVDKPG